MKKFYEWLNDEPKGWRYWKFLLISVIWMLVYGFAVGEMIVDRYLFETGSESVSEPFIKQNSLLSQDPFSERRDMISNLLTNTWWLTLLIIFQSVLSEELRFRWAALFPAEKMFGNSLITIFIAMLASFFFGWRHGHLLKSGLVFVPMQGVIGLSLCFIYLKCGGLHNRNWKALGSSFLAHLIFNLTLLVPLVIFVYIRNNHPELLNNLDSYVPKLPK